MAEELMTKFMVIGIAATILVFAIAVTIAWNYLVKSVRTYQAERLEEKRREFMRIKNHKPSSKYVYVPMGDDMYEIKKRS